MLSINVKSFTLLSYRLPCGRDASYKSKKLAQLASSKKATTVQIKRFFIL